MEFENDHVLPLMALQATWTALQHRSEKMVSIDKLLGKKDIARKGEPMSNQEMVANIVSIHKQAVALEEKKKKKNEEGKA